MKVIDNSVTGEKGLPPSRLSGVISSLRVARSLPPDHQAQETVIAIMERTLDNRFTLLRNVTLEGMETPLPLILIGPPGIQVIYTSSLRGIYRARGDEWDQMDDRQEQYRPALPNLVIQSQQMAQSLQAHLLARAGESARNLSQSPVEALIVFTDPGIHVDMVRPSVRILLIDALERFLSNLAQSPPRMEREEIHKYVELLARPPKGEAQMTPIRDAFSFADEFQKHEKADSKVFRLPSGERAVSLLNKIPFTNRQWFILGLLVLINIIILVGFVILILLSS